MSGPQRWFEKTNQELEAEIERLKEYLGGGLLDRIVALEREARERETREYDRELEQLKEAVRELQATLGLPHLIGEP
jgi:hypothetical protein